MALNSDISLPKGVVFIEEVQSDVLHGNPCPIP